MAARYSLYLFLCLFGAVKSEDDYSYEEKGIESYASDPGCATPQEECSINNATHSGALLPSPTVCNCCSYCMPHYGEGQHCSMGGPGTGFTVGRCADGLTCTPDDDDGHAYCRKMDSPCLRAQQEFDSRLEQGEVGFLEMRPQCDGKGLYAPYHCVLANTCFCQSETGERIFGEVLYRGRDTTDNKKCACSLIHEKIKKNIAPGLSLPVIGPRCTSDGNFNPVQCINKTCFCVDPVTGEMDHGDDKVVDLEEKPISELDCYDPQTDLYPSNIGQPPYNYTTPCLKAQAVKIALIQESEREGYNVDYFTSYGECLPDGTFGRMALVENGSKVCVDERGMAIKDYGASPNTAEFDAMDCKCAETEMVMSSSKEKPICCKNGNFRTIQCRRGLCYCVDSDGRQIAKESSDVTSLSCHEEDWRTC